MLRRPGQTLRALIVAFVLVVTVFLAFAAEAKDRPAFLDQQAVVLQKAADPLPDQTRHFLLNRDGDTVKTWIFFTDKGITSREDFARMAASVSMSDRAMKRRAKMGLDHIVFADLPVLQQYVDQITDLGGKHRRNSRWLNAASFEIPASRLDEICKLPFVAKIKPVILFRKKPVPVETIRFEEPDRQSLAPDVLNYGLSQAQLEQINVPAAHEQGLDGSGVTLAILDTGFRKSHEAFALHYANGRVLAEWDFVFNDGNTANEAEDWSTQWNHGTYIWSTAGGHKDGSIYGPAYNANFILCKTEDVRSETQVEEDNWVAALEWVDSLGADVVTSSLAYWDWDDGTGYTYSDMDGVTATTSAAASMAASMGIVLCTSAGNSGPGSGSLTAPADAIDVLTCGAVDSYGTIAYFSSRGPTYDNRVKPEVVALGIYTSCATATSDNSYGTASGTSLSTPLIAGAACLMVQARPGFTPEAIRLALMATADNASSPDNTYGWGLIDANAATGWGADFYADLTFGYAPATVQFIDSSAVSPSAWAWSFGDGDSSHVQNPSHEYLEAGVFDVSLTIDTYLGEVRNEKQAYIILLGDTVTFATDSAYAGGQAVMSVNLTNSQALTRLQIPFQFEDEPQLALDSVRPGERTAYFEAFQEVDFNPASNKYAYELIADDGGGSPPLPPGSGEVLKLFFTIDEWALGGLSNEVDSSANPKILEVTSEYLTYQPVVNPGQVITRAVLRGDADGSMQIDIVDIVLLAQYMFSFGPPPVSIQAGDVDADLVIDIADLIYLVDWAFGDGPPPPSP